MNAMILAAGEGTRLRPYTSEIPKPCVPFLSVPLFCYSLALLDELPIERLVANSFHLPEKLKAFVKTLPRKWKDIHLSHEEILLDSGGGIHKVASKLRGSRDFFVMNGDGVIIPHEIGLMKEMLAFHKWNGGIATLLTTDHPEVGEKFGGAWLGPSGTEVVCFSKKAPGASAPRGKHFTGVLLLSDDIFDYMSEDLVPENILYHTLTKAMEDGKKVHSFEAKVEWFETGNPTDFLAAADFCLRALATSDREPAFWKEHLKQTIRFYSSKQYVVESTWEKLPELKALIAQIKKGF